MTGSESNSFQCVACQPTVCFGDISAVEEHFLLVHKVPHLLTSPAIKAVALPSSLFCNRSSCPLPHHCSLCGPEVTSKSYFKDELRKHMATVHGEFFQRSLHQFSTSHCRLCGDIVECDEEEHNSSCPVGRVRWWKAVTGCKEAEKFGRTKLEVMGTQGLECAESGSDDVEGRKLKSKERKSEAMQVQGNGCSMASPGIKTLKVKKVVRVTTTSRDACPLLKSDDQKMKQERSRFLAEGETVNSVKIVVSSFEAKAIIGHGGGNVRKLEMMSRALIDVKGRREASQRTVEISGEKVAVVKAEELVNEFLLQNCTTTLDLCRQEAYGLVTPYFKSLFRERQGVDFFIDFKGAYGKPWKLYILGFEEEVKKAKEMIEEHLGSVLLLPIYPAEKDVLLCGGKNNLLCDISRNNLDAYITIEGHTLMIFGSPGDRKKAASAVKEQLLLSPGC